MKKSQVSSMHEKGLSVPCPNPTHNRLLRSSLSPRVPIASLCRRSVATVELSVLRSLSTDEARAANEAESGEADPADERVSVVELPEEAWYSAEAKLPSGARAADPPRDGGARPPPARPTRPARPPPEASSNADILLVSTAQFGR